MGLCRQCSTAFKVAHLTSVPPSRNSSTFCACSFSSFCSFDKPRFSLAVRSSRLACTLAMSFARSSLHGHPCFPVHQAAYSVINDISVHEHAEEIVVTITREGMVLGVAGKAHEWMMSRSATGSTLSSTCTTSASSNARQTCIMPSTSWMCDRKALPRPSPCAAPLHHALLFRSPFL